MGATDVVVRFREPMTFLATSPRPSMTSSFLMRRPLPARPFRPTWVVGTVARMRNRLRTTLVAIPLLVAPLAACGTEEASAAEIVRAAPAATVDSDTARMAFEMRMPGVPGMGDGTFTAEGAMDFAAGRGTMTFDLGPMLEAAGEQVPPDTETEISMVFDGTVIWMRFPMLTEAMGPRGVGKEWVRVDTSDAATQMGIDVSQLQQMGGNDPRQQLAYLTGVSDDVEEVGEEEVRGETTTHYRGTVTVDAVIEHLEEEDALVDPERFRETAEQWGIDEIAFDVWIDDEGRARRMVQTIPAPPEAGGGDVEIVVELYDFGTDVDVAIPPAEATIDVTELAPADPGTAPAEPDAAGTEQSG
jgi:hypothetical protein